MISAPWAIGPALGPLPEPDEQELEAAFPRLSGEALTLSWAAELLGVPVARLEALARAGELLVVPGPWPMRQAHRAGLGYLVPAWQLDGAGGLRPGIASLIRASRGRTSLGLHEFMRTAARAGEETPARLFARLGVEPVLSLLGAEGAPAVRTQPPPRRRPRRPRLSLRPSRLAAHGGAR